MTKQPKGTVLPLQSRLVRSAFWLSRVLSRGCQGSLQQLGGWAAPGSTQGQQIAIKSKAPILKGRKDHQLAAGSRLVLHCCGACPVTEPCARQTDPRTTACWQSVTLHTSAHACPPVVPDAHVAAIPSTHEDVARAPTAIFHNLLEHGKSISWSAMLQPVADLRWKF